MLKIRENNNSRNYNMLFICKSEMQCYDVITEIADIIAKAENDTTCPIAYQTTFNTVLTRFEQPVMIPGGYILELTMNLLVSTRRKLKYIPEIGFCHRIIKKPCLCRA